LAPGTPTTQAKLKKVFCFFSSEKKTLLPFHPFVIAKRLPRKTAKPSMSTARQIGAKPIFSGNALFMARTSSKRHTKKV
jgi:hypothetical protein